MQSTYYVGLDVHKKAISYCGLCGSDRRFAAKIQHTPLSRRRNKHLQRMWIETAKMAPRNSPELALLYDREKRKGNANRATLAVALKLAAYRVAVDRRQKEFLVIEREIAAAESNFFGVGPARSRR